MLKKGKKHLFQAEPPRIAHYRGYPRGKSKGTGFSWIWWGIPDN